ncbi:MAG: alpha-mannosidase [Anaerolineae bacterium]
MQRHPDITRQRLDHFAKYLQTLLYSAEEPLSLEVFSAPDRISYAQAVAGDYKPVKLWDQLGPHWSTHWFRLNFSIPQAWHGKEVHLRWDSSSEACVWRDGQPLQGLSGNADYWSSPYHEFYVLSEQAQGGEQIQLYIEVAINTPFGIVDTTPLTTLGKLRRAEIALFRHDLWDLLYDFTTIADMARFLPPESPRGGQALMTANEIVNVFNADDPTTIERAFALAAAFLSQHNGDGQHVVYAMGHAHIDTAWLWPLAETRRKCVRTFSTALTLMERYPEYKFVCSQAQQLAWMKELQPVLYERIGERVKSGHFIPVGGAWVEPDCNIPSGEALVRQFLYGQRFYQQEFGVRSREFWLPDTFGYPAALPQIMRGAGIEFFLTQKLSWNQFNKPASSTFHWEGLDGSRVITHFPPADTYNGLANVEEMMRSLKNFKDHGRSDASLYLFGFGDGGGGPNEAMLERLERMQDVAGLPRVQMDTPMAFFERVAADADKLMTWVGELYFELHRGTYTTQARNKRSNRKSELLLRDVEFLSALLPDYPRAEVEQLWKLVLLNQFHDILPGSSINEVYQDSAVDYAHIKTQGEALRDRALSRWFAAQGATHVAIVNTLSQPRREVVELPLPDAATEQYSADGKALALVEAPSMGFHVQSVHPAEHESVVLTEMGETWVLENPNVRAVLGFDGSLLSLFDKQLNREALSAPGNRFVMFDDRPNNWDAWDVDVFHLEKRRDIGGAARAEVLEQGPLRAAVRFEYALSANSTLRQTVTLTCTSAYVEFSTEVNWHEKHQFLKVEFPLTVHTSQATYETQYGLVQRPTHFNTSWDIARFEVCGHRWGALMEYGFGVALLNDSKYGYGAQGNVLRLSLLRSSTSPDAHADEGQHEFRYALYPFNGMAEQVVAAGLRFNVPLLTSATGETAGQHSYFSVEPATVVIDAVKRAEDSDALVVRLYEACGGHAAVTLHSSLNVKSVTRCNLLEEDEAALEWHHGATQFTLAPFKVVTLKFALH